MPAPARAQLRREKKKSSKLAAEHRYLQVEALAAELSGNAPATPGGSTLLGAGLACDVLILFRSTCTLEVVLPTTPSGFVSAVSLPSHAGALPPGIERPSGIVADPNAPPGTRSYLRLGTLPKRKSCTQKCSACGMVGVVVVHENDVVALRRVCVEKSSENVEIHCSLVIATASFLSAHYYNTLPSPFLRANTGGPYSNKSSMPEVPRDREGGLRLYSGLCAKWPINFLEHNLSPPYKQSSFVAWCLGKVTLLLWRNLCRKSFVFTGHTRVLELVPWPTQAAQGHSARKTPLFHPPGQGRSECRKRPEAPSRKRGSGDQKRHHMLHEGTTDGSCSSAFVRAGPVPTRRWQ